MNQTELDDFGARYAAAWSGGDPKDLAAFFSPNAIFAVNSGTPAVGRTPIAAAAGEYMAAFPDMVVRMDSVTQVGDRVLFRWTRTGTNTGPGGTGRSVRLSGYEELTFDPDGLIEACQGHFDQAEYERQVGAGS